MKVNKLIEQLKTLPKNSSVYIIYDGEPRIKANLVYESVSGKVMITDFDEPVYTKKYYPKNIVNTDKIFYTRRSITEVENK